MSDDWLARMIREAQTESEINSGKLDIGIVPDRDLSSFARNQFMFFAEDFSAPETPTMRMEREARERWRRRPINRVRLRYRQIRWRLRETWDVLLHGLPEGD